MLQKNSQDMRLQENHGLQNPPGGGKPYLATGLFRQEFYVLQNRKGIDRKFKLLMKRNKPYLHVCFHHRFPDFAFKTMVIRN